MTTRTRDDIDRILTALADPTRRRLHEAVLREPGISTSELASGTPSITRWGVMKHLDVLRSAGLIQTMATGRRRRHYAEKGALSALRTWLEAMEDRSN